jgi:hypothetical protein
LRIELSATRAPDESQNIMDSFIGKNLHAGPIHRIRSRYDEVEQLIEAARTTATVTATP